MITTLKNSLTFKGKHLHISEEGEIIKISWDTRIPYDVYTLLKAFLPKEYAIDTFSDKDGIATIMTKQAIIQRHDDRQISIEEVLKRQADGVVDPCVYCGESTAFGHGRFVNRVPADRQCFERVDGGYVDGYACDECMTPPFCEICGMNPPQESHFRCDECEEAELRLHDMLDS